jgi:hypothetical protein
MVQDAGGYTRVDVAEIRHLAERGAVELRVRGGVEAGPVAREAKRGQPLT